MWFAAEGLGILFCIVFMRSDFGSDENLPCDGFSAI